MGVGSVLVGLAVAIAVGAYLARPFRGRAAGLDRAIEVWVSQVRADDQAEPEIVEDVRHCTQCGRPAGADDRFCSGCGTRLPGAV